MYIPIHGCTGFVSMHSIFGPLKFGFQKHQVLNTRATIILPPPGASPLIWDEDQKNCPGKLLSTSFFTLVQHGMDHAWTSVGASKATIKCDASRKTTSQNQFSSSLFLSLSLVSSSFRLSPRLFATWASDSVSSTRPAQCKLRDPVVDADRARQRVTARHPSEAARAAPAASILIPDDTEELRLGPLPL